VIADELEQHNACNAFRSCAKCTWCAAPISRQQPE
jgi:hypothetical protein